MKQLAAAHRDSPSASRTIGANPASAAADDYLDGEIDKLVYQLYGLTAEEIRIVEGAY